MKALWAQRTPSERRLLLICAVVIVVAAWLVLAPSNRGGVQLLSSAEADRKATEDALKTHQYRQEIERLAPEIKRLAYDKPPAEVIPSVVRTLQDMAKQSDLHLREIKPLRARRTGDMTRIPISVRFSTAAFNRSAVGFLYRLEDPASRMVVDKFTITAPDPKTRIVDVEVQVALYTRGGASATDSGA